MASNDESRWATIAEQTRYEPETPFLETYVFQTESPAGQPTLETSTLQVETPFLTQYMGETPGNLEAETFFATLQDLHDSEFDEVLAELVGEAAALHAEHITQLGTTDAEVVSERFLQEWLEPARRDAEALLEEMERAAAQQDFYVMSEVEIDRFFEGFAPVSSGPTPVFEDFLKKIWRKAKNIAAGAWRLAKQGIKAVGKLIPLGKIFAAIKRLVQPLLQRVLQTALNKLPASLRPAATLLGQRLGILKETEEAEAWEQGEQPATPEVGAIQGEFDVQLTGMLLAEEESEQELLLAEVINEAAMPAANPLAELDAARERFIREFTQLERGQNPAPVLESFIPAVLPLVRMGMTIVGRQRIVNFLAGYLGRLIQPHVGREAATALSRALVDIGLRMVMLEAPETREAQQRLAGAAMAATVEDTVRRIAELGEEAIEDPTRLEAETLQAFSGAAARNFPPSLLRPDLPELESYGVNATWLMMPRPRYRYKKYSQVFDVTVTPQIARAVRIHGGGTLEGFLRSRGANLPVKARMHLYEALPGSTLSGIAALEKGVPGLGQGTQYVWTQLHPLTPEAAGILIQQPGLGKAVDARFLQNPNMIAVGQRFYYLEVPGMRPPVPRPSGGGSSGRGDRPRPLIPEERVVRQSQASLTIDLRQGQNMIRVAIFISEREGQELAPRLQAGEVTAGAGLLMRMATAAVTSALQNGANSVNILYESPTQEQMAAAAAGAAAGISGKVVEEVVKWLTKKILDMLWKVLVEYLKHRAGEFVTKIREPADGATVIVTVRAPAQLIILANIRRGTIPGVTELLGLRSAAWGQPVVQVVAGFQR
jgi:hypothetical protein